MKLFIAYFLIYHNFNHSRIQSLINIIHIISNSNIQILFYSKNKMIIVMYHPISYILSFQNINVFLKYFLMKVQSILDNLVEVFKI